MCTSRSFGARVVSEGRLFVGAVALILVAFSANILAQGNASDGALDSVAQSNLSQTDQCPAIDCDCEAVSSASWQQKCFEAERKIKSICAENDGKPTQYCGLQGPDASPVALMSSRPKVPPVTLQTLTQHNRQVVMLLWSIKDDLDNVRYREERAFYGDALQVHKLLDKNIERLYLTQYKAAEGERQRKGDAEAQALWREYRLEVADMLKAFEAYGEILWEKYNSAESDKGKKAYRLLAMRILRSASQLSEQVASAYAGEGNTREAAAAWQRSARLAQNLVTKEQQSEANPKHLAFYRYQTAGRWNRASYYWMESKNEAQAETTVEAAEAAVLAQEEQVQ